MGKSWCQVEREPAGLTGRARTPVDAALPRQGVVPTGSGAGTRAPAGSHGASVAAPRFRGQTGWGEELARGARLFLGGARSLLRGEEEVPDPAAQVGKGRGASQLVVFLQHLRELVRPMDGDVATCEINNPNGG